MFGKQIQTSLRLISVSLSNELYCIYDVSVVSRCTLYLNKILFTLNVCHHKMCDLSSILFGPSCSDKIKCIQHFLHTLQMNFKYLKKMRYFKKCVKSLL